MVRVKKMPAFPKLEKKAFDLVFLDPPRYAKSAFGVVDIVNDYAALMKLALLCTVEGGTLICCNNVADVERLLETFTLKRLLTPMGTILEGELDEVLRAVRAVHEAPFARGALRVSTSLRIDERRDKTLSMEGKVRAVEEKL